ncbi:uncharacterized protein isoform X2 [Leptinotarsa decemlineata]
MVSSNKRISTKQEQIIAKEKERNIKYRPRRVAVRQKLPIQLIQEILSSKINFVKSSDESECVEKKTTEIKEKSPSNRKTKTPFQLMREILTNQVEGVKEEDTKSFGRKIDLCSSTDTSEESCSSKPSINNKDIKEDMEFTKRKRRKHSKNTSEATVIDLSDSTSDSSVCSSAPDVIRISDSDSSHTDDLKKCRRKKKKLKYRKV